MRLIFVVGIFAGIMLIASSGRSQEAIDDRGAGTVNHNYFAAAYDKTLLDLVHNIEINHIDRCPHNNFNGGTLKDIANGRYDYAKGDVIYMLERFVNHPRVLQIGIMVAVMSKDRTWLLDRFEYALRWYPKYAITHAQYGAYLVELGSVSAGIERLETAVKMDPKLVAGFVWLSKAYSKQGNVEAARGAANKAKELGYKGDAL